MITLFATGGLGNQMFNYAAARSLADATNTQLVVDASFYREQWHPMSLRPHLLHRFPVRAKFRNLSSESEQRSLPRRVWRRLHEDWAAVRIDRGIDELTYFPQFAEIGSRAILKGHFIDPRFFEGNESRIAADFALCENILDGDERLKRVVDDIRATKSSVAVHVRRGDLLAPANASLLMPSMEDYYRMAVKRVSSAFDAPKLFIFSDDPIWCKGFFADLNLSVAVVSNPQELPADPLQDFFLMTQCRHHVIANSTFSWWAAWLSRHKSKQVFAPCRWDAAGLIDVDKFLPISWTKLEWL